MQKWLYSHEFLRGFKSWINVSLEANPELLEMSIGLLDPMIASPETPAQAAAPSNLHSR
jgi:hypothetical protein